MTNGHPRLARRQRHRRENRCGVAGGDRGLAGARVRGEQPADEPSGRAGQEREARPLRAITGHDRLFVLQPGTHAGIGDGRRDVAGGQLGRVVTDVEPLAHDVRMEALQADEVPEPPLDERHLLATVHPFDSEGRLGMELTDGAGRHVSAPRAPRLPAHTRVRPGR
jgi:hypothetical protein